MRSIVFLLSVIFFFRSDLCFAAYSFLWIPEDDGEISQVLPVLEANPSARLTAALSSVPQDYADRISALQKEGRLEIAVRIADNPPLPLFYYPRSPAVAWENKPDSGTLPADSPYFLGLRLALASESFSSSEIKPDGFVLPEGGMFKDYFPIAKSLKMKWLASGLVYTEQEAEITDVLEVNGIKVVSFNAYQDGNSTFDELTVFDEGASASPEAVREGLIKAISKPLVEEAETQQSQKPAGEYKTVSEQLSDRKFMTASPLWMAENIAPWTVNYNAWASNQSQLGALTALSQTRADLMVYFNSRGGVFNNVRSAFDAYFKAENGRRFMTLGSQDREQASAAENEFKYWLKKCYSNMKKNYPSWLVSSLGEQSKGADVSSDTAHVFVNGEDFYIDNDDKSVSLDEIPSGLQGRDNPGDLWKLEKLGVSVKSNSVIFRITPKNIINSEKNGSGFSYLHFDIYIDINGRTNAGLAYPLPGRPLKLSPENGWEYALEVDPSSASVYLSSSQGPLRYKVYRPRVQGDSIVVEIPRSVLKGTPKNWGYAVMMLAPKSDGGFELADSLCSDITRGYIYTIVPEKN